MKVTPKLQTTLVQSNSSEWRPCCFEAFEQELNHIIKHAQEIEHLFLFRGHADSQWLLDSTFVRSVKENVLGISPSSKLPTDYRHTANFHRLLGELLLYKFGIFTTPSRQLFEIAKLQGIDPWFEWMKRIQQYPEDDIGPIRGSFLLDWTQDHRVALYFTNSFRHPDATGAIFIADINAMGAIVHRDLVVEEILRKFGETLNNNHAPGCPLVFCPRKQIECQRAKNQDAIYIAQMDLRCDLAEIWSQMSSASEQMFIKLILPGNTVEECAAWLEQTKMTKEFIFPDKR